MNPNFKLKQIENNEDIESAISFLNEVLPHKVDESLWEWEFNSFPKDIVLTIFKDENTTVGTQFMLPIKISINNLDLLSGKCENSYFNTKYRGRGLFPKLFSFAENLTIEKAYSFLWAFTPATKVYENKLGFTVFLDVMHNFSLLVGKPDIIRIKSYTKNTNKAYLKYSYKLVQYTLFKFKYYFFSIRNRCAKLLPKYEVKNAPNSFDDIDQLYSTIKLKQNDFVHIKIDEPYLNWRTKNNINLNYVSKYFYKNGILMGYYFLALKEDSGNISDFTSLNSETANVMIFHILNEISKRNIVTLNYFGNVDNQINQNNFMLFRKFGGKIVINKGMPFVFKNNSNHNSNLKLVKNWYLNGMWTEGFTF